MSESRPELSHPPGYLGLCCFQISGLGWSLQNIKDPLPGGHNAVASTKNLFLQSVVSWNFWGPGGLWPLTPWWDFPSEWVEGLGPVLRVWVFSPIALYTCIVGWASRRRLCTPTLVQKSVSCLEKRARESKAILWSYFFYFPLSAFVKIVCFTRKTMPFLTELLSSAVSKVNFYLSF